MLETPDEHLPAASLVDEVDRARFERHRLAIDQRLAGQEYDRRAHTALAQLSQQLDARSLRQTPIEHDDIGIRAYLERIEQRVAIAKAQNRESMFGQLVDDSLAVVPIVLDQEDADDVGEADGRACIRVSSLAEIAHVRPYRCDRRCSSLGQS